jgi:putative FmdB family regulatory protein
LHVSILEIPMPIYEYHCNACGHEFEVLQKVSDELLRDCPSCSEPQLAKLVSAAGFRLKGGGWYETDFKNGREKKKNLLGEGADAKAADAKSDSVQQPSTQESSKAPASPAGEAT